MEPKAVAELAHENRSSIEVSRTSKGEYAWHIKRYYEENVNAAMTQIHNIDQSLRMMFLPEPPNLESQLEASVAQAQARKAEGVP